MVPIILIGIPILEPADPEPNRDGNRTVDRLEEWGAQPVELIHPLV